MQWKLWTRLRLCVWLCLCLASGAGGARYRAIVSRLAPRTGLRSSCTLASSLHTEPALPTPLCGANDPLTQLLGAISGACVSISRLVRSISLEGNAGVWVDGLGRAATNVHGEEQKKMDKLCDDILVDSILGTGSVHAVVSEERASPVYGAGGGSDSDRRGKIFTVAIDPLDGSSNVDSGLPTGTLFAIFNHSSSAFPSSSWEEKHLVAAGYCLYSAATQLVLTLRGDSGVQRYTLDDQASVFRLVQPQVRIPPSGAIKSFNDANADQWHPSVRRFLQAWQDGGQTSCFPHWRAPSSRYFGALVADAHNILFHGGVFGYPGTLLRPHGKLRLLYEAIPIAVILESAGGRATNGTHRILDIPVRDVHQRTPLFLGSAEQVSALQAQWRLS